MKIKDQLFITAIKNLIKKNNYLQLNLEFSHGSITEKEFEKEIEDNSKKYVVDIKSSGTIDELIGIHKIVQSLEINDLDTSDVSELFSIDHTWLCNNLAKILK